MIELNLDFKGASAHFYDCFGFHYVDDFSGGLNCSLSIQEVY